MTEYIFTLSHSFMMIIMIKCISMCLVVFDMVWRSRCRWKRNFNGWLLGRSGDTFGWWNSSSYRRISGQWRNGTCNWPNSKSYPHSLNNWNPNYFTVFLFRWHTFNRTTSKELRCWKSRWIEPTQICTFKFRGTWMKQCFRHQMMVSVQLCCTVRERLRLSPIFGVGHLLACVCTRLLIRFVFDVNVFQWHFSFNFILPKFNVNPFDTLSFSRTKRA